MRKPFSGQKKPVKLGRVIIFLTFDALDRIFCCSKRGRVQVHPNLMTIFWGLQNHVKSVTFRRTGVLPRPNPWHDDVPSRRCCHPAVPSAERIVQDPI